MTPVANQNYQNKHNDRLLANFNVEGGGWIDYTLVVVLHRSYLFLGKDNFMFLQLIGLAQAAYEQ